MKMQGKITAHQRPRWGRNLGDIDAQYVHTIRESSACRGDGRDHRVQRGHSRCP